MSLPFHKLATLIDLEAEIGKRLAVLKDRTCPLPEICDLDIIFMDEQELDIAITNRQKWLLQNWEFKGLAA
jgi:hypothetical protein